MFIQAAIGEATPQATLQQANSPPPYCSQGLKNHTLPQNISPSNFLVVKQDLPISGTVVIDPNLEVHDDLLICDTNPGSFHGRDKNLVLETKAGYVSANIWLVDGITTGDNDKLKRAVIDVKAHRRSPAIATRIKLYTASSLNYSITISVKGNVHLSLPLDFVGPVSLDISESVSFSSTVRSKLTTFSVICGRWSCFIGDYRNAKYKGVDNWTGSAVKVTTEGGGKLLMSFVDDTDEMPDSSPGCIVM